MKRERRGRREDEDEVVEDMLMSWLVLVQVCLISKGINCLVHISLVFFFLEQLNYKDM